MSKKTLLGTIEEIKRLGDAALYMETVDDHSTYYVMVRGARIPVYDARSPVITKAIVSHLLEIANKDGVLVVNNKVVSSVRITEDAVEIDVDGMGVVLRNDQYVQAGSKYVRIGKHTLAVYSPKAIFKEKQCLK